MPPVTRPDRRRLTLRWLYRLAYPLARLWWWLRRPAAAGVAIALLDPAGRVLVVRQSFRPGLGLVAGGIDPGERPAQAAIREIQEEVGIAAAAGGLRPLDMLQLTFECRALTVHLFELHLATAPEPRPDGAEIVAACWRDPATLDPAAGLHPTLAHWLERHGSGSG